MAGPTESKGEKSIYAQAQGNLDWYLHHCKGKNNRRFFPHWEECNCDALVWAKTPATLTLTKVRSNSDHSKLRKIGVQSRESKWEPI